MADMVIGCDSLRSHRAVS